MGGRGSSKLFCLIKLLSSNLSVVRLLEDVECRITSGVRLPNSALSFFIRVLAREPAGEGG
jgi:hypothetical protein